MKKFMVMLVAAAALTASADYYLSWTVSGAPIEYSYARVYAVQSTTTTALGIDTTAELPVNLSVLDDKAADKGGASTVLTSLGNSTKAYYGSGYNYYFELFNSSDEAVAWWNGFDGDGDIPMSWSDIEKYVYKNSMSQNETLALNSSMFTTTPEPTSGLMLLLGLAGLALKRKRA